MKPPARGAASDKRPPTIVDGIKLHVAGRDLAVRLDERIRWHGERGDALLAHIRKLGEVERDTAMDIEGGLVRYDSPRPVLEKKLREHRERAAFLSFVRDHLNPDNVYRLDHGDMRMTEILPEKPC